MISTSLTDTSCWQEHRSWIPFHPNIADKSPSLHAPTVQLWLYPLKQVLWPLLLVNICLKLPQNTGKTSTGEEQTHQKCSDMFCARFSPCLSKSLDDRNKSATIKTNVLTLFALHKFVVLKFAWNCHKTAICARSTAMKFHVQSISQRIGDLIIYTNWSVVVKGVVHRLKCIKHYPANPDAKGLQSS